MEANIVSIVRVLMPIGEVRVWSRSASWGNRPSCTLGLGVIFPPVPWVSGGL